MNPADSVADNLSKVRSRIREAAFAAGRRPEEIRLVAVTKTVGAARVREALEAGVTEFAENYVQEAEAKLAELGPVPAIRHLIGHLQRNKAGKAAALFEMVQTVDRVEVARALGRRGAELGRTLDILLEVNISGEESKFGIEPARALDLAGQAADIEGIRLRGLMGLGPLEGDETTVRAAFRALRGLYDRLPQEHRQVLSMGMTGDFELAIAEGSTMVRIGTGIFGARTAPA